MALGDGWHVGLGPTIVARWVQEEGGWPRVGWGILGCWEREVGGRLPLGQPWLGPAPRFLPGASGSEAIGHLSVPATASATADLGLKASCLRGDGTKDTSDEDDAVPPRLAIPRSQPQQDSTNLGLSTDPSTQVAPLPSLQPPSALVAQLCRLRTETGR